MGGRADATRRGGAAVSLVAALLGCAAAAAQNVAPFHGKTVTMIIGYAAGGGTDTFGRLTAGFLQHYLPGSPTVIVRNVPGADGIAAMNYFVEQVASNSICRQLVAHAADDGDQ